MSALHEVLDQAGFVGPVLAGCLVVLWAALGARLWALRAPRDLRAEALAVDAPPTGFTGEAAALLRAEAARGVRDPAALQARLAPFLAELSSGRTLVRSLTAVAPLLGLLGTVTGMIETFDSLGEMALFTRGGGIGAGIGEAMVSTQVGLVVAVPGLLLGALLERREDSLVDALEGAVAALAGGQGRAA